MYQITYHNGGADLTTLDTQYNLSDIKGKEVKISIILPTYKEQELISRLIKTIFTELEGENIEIIVVDDSSPDGTAIVVKDIISKTPEYNLILLERKKRGVFSAQQDGIKVAKGEIVILMDADFSHPVKTIKDLLKHIKDYDLVSGSRFLKDSNIISPLPRKLPTISLNMFLRLIMGLGITDYTSIFFAVKKDKWEKLNFRYDSVWGEAGLEIFEQARAHNLKIKEIPFTYNYREEGVSKAGNYLKYAFIYVKRALQVKFFYRGKNGHRS